MSTRAKFECISVTDYGASKEVKLNAVYSGSKNAEDNQFSKSTPTGNVTMNVSNPAVFDFFKPGSKYYLDFSEVE